MERRSFFRKLVGGAAAVVAAPEILARVGEAARTPFVSIRRRFLVGSPRSHPEIAKQIQYLADAKIRDMHVQLAESFYSTSPEWEWADGTPDTVHVVKVVDTVPVDWGEGCASD